MKITCPECSSTFDIPPGMMPEGGRRLRCAACGHIWHQMPVVKDPYAYNGSIDPIPDSVRPGAHDDDGQETGPGFLGNLPWPMILRIAAGFAVGWAVILALVYVLAVAGMAPRILAPLAPGQVHAENAGGLEFHDVTAHARDGGVALSGRVFNNSEESHPIPMVEIIPVTDGHDGEPKQVRPEQDTLQPQEGVMFQAQLPGVAADARLRLRFITE